MKIGVLFNCHAVGLAASLGRLLPAHEILSYRFVDVAASPASIAETAEALRDCDVVVTTAASARLGAAHPAKLAAAGVRLLKIPHLVFGGFHPDACYSPDPARGIPGPTERFHSRIAACAYLAGLDVTDTVDLYNKLAFARLGYFDQFAQQRAAMLEQWSSYGIDLAPWFARWMEAGCFMHSANHPKINALFDVARVICDILGVQPDDTALPPPDNMLIFASHPVYADLAEFLAVAPETDFRPSNVEGRPYRMMDLPTFIASSFKAFAAAPPGSVRDLDGVPSATRALNLES